MLESGKPVWYYCHAGLVDFAAPIMLGDRMIGSFIGGQVLAEEPDYGKMRCIARELGLDEDGFAEAAGHTQIVPIAAIERSTNFIFEFSRVISDMAYKTYETIRLSKLAVSQKSDFLANMSHEIRTPMIAVPGMAEMALREEMTPNAKQYIRQIRSSGKHLLVIINDILDFSKIESGKMNIVKVDYEPLSLVNDLVNIVNTRIGSKKLEFTIDFDPSAPQKLYGDNVRIHQILLNVLNNAVKFKEHGEVPIIALTANSMGGTKEMFLREGMNDFVAKPIEVTEIVSMVKKWLPKEKVLPAAENKAGVSEQTDELVIPGLNTRQAISMLGS